MFQYPAEITNRKGDILLMVYVFIGIYLFFLIVPIPSSTKGGVTVES